MAVGGNFTSCNCGPNTTACESPTEPVATVGLCLADGTPVAVTVVRDCTGAVASEGWLNLTTGAWSAGPPPAGAVACGDSRSIQVSGTFCDVDPDSGDVLGLVLVEYAYAADGSIAGVRLVDAVTGDTYTPTGTVTTCPAGVEQPDRDLVQLCDVADGTAVPFVRDFARSQTGAITGHTDYDLDGAPYTPTGTVGVCPADTPCANCEAHVLCDAAPVLAALALVPTSPNSLTLADGETTLTRTGGSGTVAAPYRYLMSGTNAITLTASAPAFLRFDIRLLSGTGCYTLPEGSRPLTLAPNATWDAAARTFCVTTPGTAPSTFITDARTVFAFAVQSGGIVELSDLQAGTATTSTPFLRTVCRDCGTGDVEITDTLLDGTTGYTPTGAAGVCLPESGEPCASTVTTLRLCDLDPDVEPDTTGKRCAVPYLRHLVHDCSGAVIESRDTTTDGTTPYSPVQPVDCGSGGVPAIVEVPWEIVSIEQDPDSPAGRGFLYSLSPIDDPDTVGVVKVTTTSTANTACANTPPNYSFANPTTYTFQPDQVLQDNATYVRCDLLDFDTFEPVTGLNPPPSRLGGTAYWDGTTVRPTVSNGAGELYYDGPPAQWSYRVGNTGGGLSCSSLSFAAISLRPEGCCAPCGEGGSGDSGRTVQEVCVISNAAPTVVMTWTRVIEDGGATIYYLDQAGARYDNTLPAAHQIVACPAEEPEPCLNSTTVLLCDAEEEQAEPVPTEGEPTVTDLVPPAPLESAHVALEGGGASLWSGGSLVFPADATGSQVYRTVAATLTAPRPSCDDGTVTVTASVHVHLDGPASTGGYGGALRLFDGAGTMVAQQGPPSSAPPGYDAVLTVTGDVPAADLAAGAVTVWLALETQQAGPKAWTTDNFEVSHVFNAPAEPCAEPVPVQFFRTLVTDCATGEVVSTSDTTLDGQPYTVAGEVGQCTAVGGGETEPGTCVHCETLPLCDVQPDESPGEPELAYETIPLADLGPAGSYGDGSPVTGTLPNGVGYSVNVGEWGPGQGHYTFYPYDGTQLWTFTEPVYLRFGLRGLNITPTECYVIPEGAVAESISANHTWDPDSRLLCEITGQSSATDESTFLLGPVTELPIVPSGSSTGGRGPGLIEVGLPVEAPAPGSSTTFFRVVCRDCSGAVTSVTDTTLDGEPYTPSGEVTTCGSASGGGQSPEPCRDTSSTLLCDTSATDVITVFDPANVAGSDGWEVVSFEGANTGYGPDGALPYPAPHGSPFGYPALGARADQSAGPGGTWYGYDTATVRWVLRKTFTAPEDGVAVAQSAAFRGDGGARVRINGQDAGMYGQWNQPATSGTASIPVTAGPNVVEIEVRDTAGPNNVLGRLDIAMPRTVQFMRRQVTDCETGDVVATFDTTMDGEPYEVLGEVGQCVTADGGCCEQPPPELRVDVESHVMCIQDGTGEITGQVLVERVYDDQGGERLEQRLTDLTTGDPVELPAGAELVLCQEPPCPTAFSTECVGVVERSEASYDNTSLIGGVPGQCGGVQGPGGQFPCQPTTGGLTITSWIVNGEEVIGDGGRNFAGGPCGPGTAGSPGMHANWSAALTNLDPTGATWSAQTEPACAWFVGSTGGTSTTYGPMVVEDAAGQQWTLTPAQSCRETQFTKVYSQECNGGVSVSWLDADGVETDAPEGQQVPCGTGCGSGGGRGLDVEPVLLCDVAEDGTTTFLRHLSYGAAGQVAGALDTALDGFTPYTPTGTVGRCQPDPGEGRDVELVPMCVVDNATGGVVARILAEATYDSASGERLSVTYVDPLTWGPVPLPGGTHVDLCPDPEPGPDVELLPLCDIADGATTPFLRHLLYPVGATAPTVLDTGLDGVTPYTVTGEVGTCPAEEECPSRNVLSACRWDDTDGDGIADTEYVELLAVDCVGALTSVGTFLPDLSEPYTPVSPVDGSTADPGPEPAVTVQAHRVQLAPGGTWDAASVAALRSVTMTAHSGTGELTTADGVSSLFPGESVTWSVDKDVDAALVGPLTVTAGAGPVTVTWTRAV